MTIGDETRRSLGLPPDAKTYARKADEALSRVDHAELDDQNAILYALAAAAISIASSATGLDDLRGISNLLERLVDRG